MLPNIVIWNPEVGFFVCGIGIVFVHITMLGTNMVTNSLQQITQKLTDGPSDKLSIIEKELQEETLRYLQMEFESTAILFKLVQSVGIGIHVGFIAGGVGFLIAKLGDIYLLGTSVANVLANASFILVLFPALIIAIGYIIHRTATHRLKGLQERLHSLRLRFLVRC